MSKAPKSTAGVEAAILDKSLRRAFMRGLKRELDQLGFQRVSRQSLATTFSEDVQMTMAEHGLTRVSAVRELLRDKRITAKKFIETKKLEKSLSRAFMRALGPAMTRVGLSANSKKNLALDFTLSVRGTMTQENKTRVSAVREHLGVSRLALQFTKGILDAVKTLGDQKIIVVKAADSGAIKIKHKGKRP